MGADARMAGRFRWPGCGCRRHCSDRDRKSGPVRVWEKAETVEEVEEGLEVRATEDGEVRDLAMQDQLGLHIYSVQTHAEDGSLWGEVLELPGLYVTGDDIHELIRETVDVIPFYLENLRNGHARTAKGRFGYRRGGPSAVDGLEETVTPTTGPWAGESDFCEDDEPLEDILRITSRPPDAVTEPPPGWTGPVYEPEEKMSPARPGLESGTAGSSDPDPTSAEA